MTDLSSPAPCLRCGVELGPVMSDADLPYRGTVFQADGNFGSTVFDPSLSWGRARPQLQVIICDDCLLTVAKQSPGVIRLVTPVYAPQPPAEVTAWQPDEEDENDENEEMETE